MIGRFIKGLGFLDSFLCLTQHSIFKELARGADRVGFLQKFNRFIKKKKTEKTSDFIHAQK